MIQTGIWKKEKDGKTFFSGNLFGIFEVTLWENESREEGSNAPHYNLRMNTPKGFSLFKVMQFINKLTNQHDEKNTQF